MKILKEKIQQHDFRRSVLNQSLIILKYISKWIMTIYYLFQVLHIHFFIFSWHYLQVAHDTVDYDIRITQINQMQDLNRQKKFHLGKLQALIITIRITKKYVSFTVMQSSKSRRIKYRSALLQLSYCRVPNGFDLPRMYVIFYHISSLSMLMSLFISIW